jgi:hypothetical protein
MALSTFFADSKLANEIGGIFLLIPQLLFLYLGTRPAPTCYVIYALYWLPITPACAIFSSLTINTDPKLKNLNIIDLSWLDINLTWLILALNIPFWIMLYQYFDSIMPSEYGI